MYGLNIELLKKEFEAMTGQALRVTVYGPDGDMFDLYDEQSFERAGKLRSPDRIVVRWGSVFYKDKFISQPDDN